MNAEIVRRLESIPVTEWSGTVYRHTFGDRPPAADNSRGARWSPPETPAIYCSLSRDTAIAESEHLIQLYPVAPSKGRKINTIKLRLSRVADLSNWKILGELGVERADFEADDYGATQLVGGAAEWLGYDGIIVPSARHAGMNLVIFPRKAEITDYFDVVNVEVIQAPAS